MTDEQITFFLLAISAPSIVYILARICAIAYFRSKRDYTRALLKELGDNKQPKQE